MGRPQCSPGVVGLSPRGALFALLHGPKWSVCEMGGKTRPSLWSLLPVTLSAARTYLCLLKRAPCSSPVPGHCYPSAGGTLGQSLISAVPRPRLFPSVLNPGLVCICPRHPCYPCPLCVGSSSLDVRPHLPCLFPVSLSFLLIPSTKQRGCCRSMTFMFCQMLLCPCFNQLLSITTGDRRTGSLAAILQRMKGRACKLGHLSKVPLQ